MSNNTDFSYKKPEASIEARTPVISIEPAPIEDLIPIISPPGYIKPQEFETPKSFIVIFSGGTKRERDYFSPILIHKDSFPCLKIDFIPEDKFGQDDYPLVFSMAEIKVKDYQTSATENNPDSYFVVSDVDHFKRHLLTFMPTCKLLNINLIISNPCLEVWLYYSKFSDKFDGFKMPEDLLQLSQEVKSFVSKKAQSFGGINTKSALFNAEMNIQNSKKNYSEEIDGFPGQFSTNMHELIEFILPMIKEGLLELQHQREKIIAQHLGTHE